MGMENLVPDDFMNPIVAACLDDIAYRGLGSLR